MSFDVNRSPRTSEEVKQKGVEKQETEEGRQQVGARFRKSVYRQLKARAALQGGKVQDLVEQAINEYLANHPAESV